jgi:predicted chitinase
MGTKTIIKKTTIIIQEPKLKKEDKTIVLSAYPVWVEYISKCEEKCENKCVRIFTNNQGEIVIDSVVGYDILISKYDTITKKKAKFIAKIDKNLVGKKVTIEAIKTLVKNRTVKFKNVLHEADLIIIASELGHKGATVFGNKRFSAFAVELNKMMTTYQINTRLRLIHFLAQTYHETGGFTSLKENGSISYFKTKDYGADFYGRGLLHLTWDYGYLEYYSYLHPAIVPSYFELYNGLRGDEVKRLKKLGKEGASSSVSFYSGLTYNGKYDDGRPKVGTLPKDIDTTLVNFSKTLETDLHLACDSSGWYWRNKNINSSADTDDVKAVTTKINGGDNGLTERIKYTEILRKVII